MSQMAKSHLSEGGTLSPCISEQTKFDLSPPFCGTRDFTFHGARKVGIFAVNEGQIWYEQVPELGKV